MTVTRLAAVGGAGPRGAGGRAGEGLAPAQSKLAPGGPTPAAAAAPARYWMWQAVEDVAWQHMQVGFTDLGGMRSRSSSSGISSNR